MKKAILVLALIISMILCGTAAACKINEPINTTTSEAYIPSETQITLTPQKYERINTTNLNELEELMQECLQRQNEAHKMAESARNLNYLDDHPIIKLAGNEWNSAYEDYTYYLNIYTQEKEKIDNEWNNKMNEYPVATIIWRYMKDLGWNDYVCAGIMGNMMAEVGGQTLNIQPYAGSSYYGICQWSSGYNEVWGADLNGQLDFLRDTIQYEFDTFGYAYQKGFDYNDFLNLTNEQDAAKAFAKCYERCGSGSYSIRQKNATIAYEYFVS